MLKTLCFIVLSAWLILVSCAYSKGQGKVDSLFKALEIAGYDTNRVNILNALCYEHITTNLDKALKFGKQGLNVAYKIKYLNGIGNSYLNIGICYSHLGNNTKGLQYFNAALFLFKEAGNRFKTAKVYNNIGVFYSSSGDYVKALEYYQKAIGVYNELGNSRGIALCYNNIGVIYNKQNNYIKALEYYNKALAINKKINDKDRMASAYNNIGGIYNNLKKFPEALYNFSKSLSINKELDNKLGISYSYLNIGLLYKDNKEYNKALICFERAFDILKVIDDKIWLSFCLNDLTELYIILNDYEKAMFYGEQALLISSKANLLEQKISSYRSLSVVYDSLGNYEKALKFHVLYSHARDSVLNCEIQKKLIEKESKYEAEEREKQIVDKNARISLLEKDREISIYKFSGLFLLVLISGGVAFVLRKRIKLNRYLYQQKVKYLESRKLLSDAEVNNQKLKSLQLQNELEFKSRELEYKNHELINLALHITEKNDFLKELKAKLSNAEGDIKAEELRKLLNTNLRNLEKDRKEFDAHVENIGRAFFVKLRELVPDITKYEERLCELLRLGLKTREIAAIMNISLKSVEVARFRLRKKLNINKTEDNLNEFLRKL